MHLLLLPLLFLCLLPGGTSTTPQEELQILLQLKSSLSATAKAATFQSWDAAAASPCNFTGVKCDATGSVSEIDLSNSGISGEVPFGSLCRLPSLSVLSLTSNNLSGGISADGLQNCTGLRTLELAFNNLTGAVPNLSPLDNLQILNISSNNFTGAFPWSSLANLNELQVLSLGDNFYHPSGAFPDVVVTLTKLTRLYLSNCNIQGQIPPSIGNLTELVDLEIADNFLTGVIPPEISKLTNLFELELYDNSLNGTIPARFGKLSKLAFFDASMNLLEGDLSELRNLTNLISLQLFQNNLSGELPPEFGDFRYLTNLSLYSNRLNGTLPSKLGSWTEFNFIDVSTNFFTGAIPPDMCKMGEMKKLLILDNKFTGEIPTSYANCTSLIRFRVSKNSLSGEVPTGLWSLPKLNIIDLAINQFQGPIGSGIGKAKSLYQLYLADNRFSGQLPPEIGEAASLVSIDLSYNEFTDEIPTSIGGLENLVSLYMQSNSFSGAIPDTIGSCVSLSSVNLAMNNLSGPIPASLGELTRLNSLDLSNNQLTGDIPASLTTLKLSSLDLSNNRLTGAVPAGLAIPAYSASFYGNPGLCVDGDGTGNLGSLSRCRSAAMGGSSNELRTILTCFLASAAVLLACLGLYIVLKKRRADKCGGDCAVVKDPSWNLKSFRILTFNDQEIVEGIKPDNLIGRGGSGEVYRVELASGEVVAVKQIWSDPVGGSKERSTAAMLAGKGRGRRRPSAAVREFEAEVGTLSTVRHVNVVKLYCSITSEEWNLLVYEHLPNGSLWDRLHGSPAAGKVGELGWEERYEIAVGAARGLEYLHHGWDRPILHRDVKSSNILLDECLKPRIADFGLAKVLHSAAAGGDDSSAHVIAGTHGYIAPEYAYTWKVNEKGDVYSFGVVLMELVTGRQPIEPEYGEYKDIVHWVSTRMSSRESMMTLVDRRIPEWAREEAVRVLRVAVLCTARLPAMRPSMRTVVQMLEEAACTRAFVTIDVGKDEKAENGSGYKVGPEKQLMQ